MEVGRELLGVARAAGARSLFVVGTGKNVGKTVALRAVYAAACARGISVGLASIGRDGEAVDIGDAQPKPRLWLREGTVLATARNALPRTPASAIVDLSPLTTAAGALVYARVAAPGYFELIGPPTARGVREVRETLLRHAEFAVIDGALDRIAALAGGDDAIVVATGAAGRSTMREEVAAVAGLVSRLATPVYDPERPAIVIEGALTASRAATLIAQQERRQVVVADPTKLALGGRSAADALAHLDIRCTRPLKAVAVTVASIGRERAFEPVAFARAVAAATGLPVFDVYAGTRAA